ncbi:MAG TPA: hypothetical protein ENN27_00520 [Candidatus Atribacteria bacterium]|nr:hypothetical protein [Candidatus Atribacteria bacterium]
MLATIAELITSVRYLVREPTAAYWSDAEITTYINEAQEIIATETKLLSKLYSHTLTADDIKNDREIRLYSDFVALDEGGVLYDDKPLEQTSLKELDEHFSNWRDTTGTPTRFYFRSDMIGFFPKPSAGGVVKYYGIERAPELSGDTVPLSGDYRTVAFRRYMRDYAAGMCWYGKNEYAKGDRWMMGFERGIQNINAILNGHRNQGAKIIPAYVPRGHAYAIRWGRTDYAD